MAHRLVLNAVFYDGVDENHVNNVGNGDDDEKKQG